MGGACRKVSMERNFSVNLNIISEILQRDCKNSFHPSEILKSTFSLMVKSEQNIHSGDKRTLEKHEAISPKSLLITINIFPFTP